MAPIPRTKQDVVERVLRKLGSPPLKVELTPAQLEDAYDDAVRWFIGRKGVRSWVKLNVVAGKQDYTELPDNIDSVVEVVPPKSGLWDVMPWGAEAAFLGIHNRIPIDEDSPFSPSAYDADYSAVVQGLQYSEQARRILGGDFGWEWNSSERLLRIYPKPTSPGYMMVGYIANEIDLRKMQVREVDLVVRRALAEAKGSLGRIRSKYQEWPMAGGDKTMDGDTLLTEAETEKEKLDVEIEDLSYPIPFLSQ